MVAGTRYRIHLCTNRLIRYHAARLNLRFKSLLTVCRGAVDYQMMKRPVWKNIVFWHQG